MSISPDAFRNELTSSLFGGRISTSNDGQRLVSKDRYGSVAYRTSRNSTLPISVFSREEQSLCRSSSGNDDRVGSHKVGFFLFTLGPVLEGSLSKVDSSDCLGDDLGTESLPEYQNNPHISQRSLMSRVNGGRRE